MHKTILVPLDGSELAECVLPHVEAMAQGCGADKVVFFQVVEPLPTPPSNLFKENELVAQHLQNMSAAESYLNSITARFKSDDVTFESKTSEGAVSETLVDYITNNDVDLVMIATHGRSGASRWAHGSIADRVLRHSCAPVFMVRAPGCAPDRP